MCQLHRNEEIQSRQLQHRINLKYKAMSRLSMALKVMPRTSKRHIFLLVVIDEVTTFMVTIQIHQQKSEEIGDGLIEHVFRKYNMPEYMIMDLYSAFMSTVIIYLFKRLAIKTITVTLYNHQCLQAEHSMRSLVTILAKHLIE